MGVTGSQMRQWWNIILLIFHEDQRFEMECHLVDSNVPNLLSTNDYICINQARRVHYNEIDVISGYDDVFSGVDRIPCAYALPIDPHIPSVALNSHSLLAALQEAIKKKLNELMN